MFNGLFTPTLLAIFELLFAVVPIGIACTAVAAFLRFVKEPKPEPSQGQILVDLSVYALGTAALSCLICLLCFKFRRELPSLGALLIIVGALGLGAIPVSVGFALGGRGRGRLPILVAHGLLTLTFVGTYYLAANQR
jgi:hypothetical protein